MNREQIVEVVKVHLSDVGTLVANLSNKKVEVSASNTIISWGPFVVIDQISFPVECDCGEIYNDDCEQCSDHLNYLVDKVEEAFNSVIDLAEFLEMGSDAIEKQVDKEMEQLGQYADASDILKFREQYTNRLTYIYEGADYITKEAAKLVLEEAFVDHSIYNQEEYSE